MRWPRGILQPAGEIRDRSFEQQRYRASGVNLVTAANVLWNTVHLERDKHATWTWTGHRWGTAAVPLGA